MKNPAFLLYTKDFLEGTEDLTHEETGMYIRLLCHQWERGSLPADIERLSRLLKVPEGTLEGPLKYLLPKFEKRGEKMYNVRLESERNAREEYLQHQKLKGIIGVFLKEQKGQLTKKQYDKIKKEITQIDLKGMDEGSLKGTLHGALSMRVENEDILSLHSSTKDDLRYNTFYDDQLEKSQNNPDYEKFIKVLFGENSTGKKLESVLRMPQQMTWEEFKRLMFFKEKYHIKVTPLLEAMENNKKLKDRKSLWLSFQTYMKNGYPQTINK